MTRFSVLGCGAWATTVAKMLAENGHHVSLWCHRSAYVDTINTTRTNTLSLPGILLPDTLSPTLDLQCIETSDAVILGVPSIYLGPLFLQLTRLQRRPILSLIKGVLQRPDWQLSHYFATHFEAPYALLSGPNLAKEIATGCPAASVVASAHLDIATFFQRHLSRPYFRIYTSDDVCGVELGGILKNVMAIAAGICDGHQWGLNAKASLLTRALKEMTTFGAHFGAKTDTFYGLSGLGDLMATAHSEASRNWQIGHKIANGLPLNAVSLGSAIPEGVRTTLLLKDVAKENNLHLPILSEVCSILEGKSRPKDSLSALMGRALTTE